MLCVFDVPLLLFSYYPSIMPLTFHDKKDMIHSFLAFSYC